MTLTIQKSRNAAAMPRCAGSDLSGRFRPPTAMLKRAALHDRIPSEARTTRHNDAVHFIIVVAVIVLLAIAATIAAATVIMCASQGGVLSSYFSLDPWTIRIDCVRI